MDLKSTLSPGDLFVSYWFDKCLTIVVGDYRKILSVETVSTVDLVSFITDFEEQVTNKDRYALFLSEQHRPRSRPLHDRTHLSISKILNSLGSRLVTSTLCKWIISGNYRRLIIFPDSILNALPIHILIDLVVGRSCGELFPDGILYAPSASAYVYACSKRREGNPRHAAILIGDENDPEINREAENAAKKIPCPSSLIRRKADLKHISPETDILYVATHGGSPGKIVEENDRDCLNWKLLFDNDSLNIQDFFSGRIKLHPGAVVVLSACSVGHLMTKQIHEIEGLVSALFYAGAATVLAARWPILYKSAEAVFLGTIELVYQHKYSFGAALNGALTEARQRKDIKQMMIGPEAETFFWGPFSLFGCGK